MSEYSIASLPYGLSGYPGRHTNFWPPALVGGIQTMVAAQPLFSEAGSWSRMHFPESGPGVLENG